MGIVIDLRARRPAGAAICAADIDFYFDLGCAFSYLAAERVERCLGEVRWLAVSLCADQLVDGAGGQGVAGRRTSERRAAERRAAELRLPLSWPERLPVQTLAAHRVASMASELHAASRFALAAFRLAFAGGFDLSDPEVLLEAAAAAGISSGQALAAAEDPSRDGQLLMRGARLRADGVSRLPAMRVRGRWLEGEGSLPQAALLVRGRAS